MNIYLQLFLLLNVFAIGVLTPIAVRHARAHFKPHPSDTKDSHIADHSVRLPQAVREKLLEEAGAKFQAVLDRSASELERDLKNTSANLGKQLEKIGTEVVMNEIKHYQAILVKLREETEASAFSGRSEINKHQTELTEKLNVRQAELEAALTEEVAAEKERLLKQIDTKLADAVASFLVETLQHNVDLGSQTAYLTTMLDEHKAEIAKKVSDEA